MKQALNAKNFIKIYYDENRKGNYLDNKFDELKKVKCISELIIKFNNKKYPKSKKEQAKKVIEYLKKRKYNCLEKIFGKVEEKVHTNKKLVNIKVQKIKGKDTYIVDKSCIASFFLLKQIQKNIKSSFDVQQMERNEIVEQLKNTLDNAFPKYIIRTDIQSFYESIPHNSLINIINNNYLLSYESKKVIRDILYQYKEISKKNKGIPRGVGISAYLAEAYIKSLDDHVRTLDSITYYARYVDDIIAVFTPANKHQSNSYIKNISNKVKEIGLELKTDKTNEISFINPSQNDSYNFDFLGYNFECCFNGKKVSLNIDITEAKLKKYKEKLDAAICEYNNASKYNNEKAKKLLIKRIKYLTGNTRLLGVKKDILIGIYFSNQQMNHLNGNIKKLDDYYKYQALDKISPHEKLQVNIDKLKQRLQLFSFREGFNTKRFHKFSNKELQLILKVWKNDNKKC
ncbi:antiviral reverse transcriptase Drt3a [Francisella philomiragia]|uniref:antiviral reverse transcriptase Drt3a n=1 Tax=Francisella philomiragia TaxID=28110 RepID=UPI001C9DDCD9|nr:antiviral reverse transcriptase Drt3a [Francisella philomiragia]MBY7733444.1 RNA-directed DNA polymerase [Francisella philomiragia]